MNNTKDTPILYHHNYSKIIIKDKKGLSLDGKVLDLSKYHFEPSIKKHNNGKLELLEISLCKN